MRAMIDRLELRVPARAKHTQEFSDLYQRLRSDRKDPFHPSKHYAAVGDLRPSGHPVVLHSNCLHGDRGDHKLEIVDSGALTFGQMMREIQRIFDIDPYRLHVMRIDLAADVRGVPVPWFVDHASIKHKRFTSEIGSVPYNRQGRLGIETLYLGKRPNLFRIYNKIAEWQHQYARLQRRENGPHRSFEELFGYPEEGVILTRVERQIGGSQAGKIIGTVYNLKFLTKFNPFENLEIRKGLPVEPPASDYCLSAYLQGLGLRQLIKRDGIQRVRQLISRRSPGNAKRWLHRLRDFIPSDQLGFNEEALVQIYRESVEKQLAG